MKKIELPSGRYVVAVSGGVDSVVLLDNLAQQKDLQLVVAHFDHGIREDSKTDREFVEQMAQKYKLPFEYREGKLGPKTSEASAREARYKYLEEVRSNYDADAIVTAHHQDDLLETIILNLLRGTGRKGLSSLGSTKNVKRPMLEVRKVEILEYAKAHDLDWREDITNQDTSYTRNWIRLKLMPKLSEQEKQKLLQLHSQLKSQNSEIDELLKGYTNGKALNKKDLILLPHNVAKELIAAWLRANNIRNFDQKIIERIVVGAKTLQKGKIIPVIEKHYIKIEQEKLALTKHE